MKSTRVPAELSNLRTLVATVGYRNLSDLSVGPNLLTDLQAVEWQPGVDVEDLSYGPIAVVQNLEDRSPYDRMVFISAAKRDRAPARVYRYLWDQSLPAPDEIQSRIGEAITGVISLDNLLIIGRYFRVLAPEVIVIEVEPLECDCGESCSAPVNVLLPEIVKAVKAEAHA